MDKIEELKKLKSLLDNGSISQEEFNLLKAEILENEELLTSAAPLNKESYAKPTSLHTDKIKKKEVNRNVIYIAILIIIIFLIWYIIVFNKEPPMNPKYD